MWARSCNKWRKGESERERQEREIKKESGLVRKVFLPLPRERCLRSIPSLSPSSLSLYRVWVWECVCYIYIYIYIYICFVLNIQHKLHRTWFRSVDECMYFIFCIYSAVLKTLKTFTRHFWDLPFYELCHHPGELCKKENVWIRVTAQLFVATKKSNKRLYFICRLSYFITFGY